MSEQIAQVQARSFSLQLDDISLQITEWPGSGDPVLLLHATGFHSRCWNQIARRLPGVHLYAVDLRFHGGSGRHGEVDWGIMAHDIEQVLRALDLTRVVGVGHSIGGHLIARAAAMQLPRFKQLLLIDPVILPREAYARRFPPGQAIDPAASPVSRRKNRWQDAQEMYQRFSQRPPFDCWQDEVLRDYCDYALMEVPGESAYQLACDPLHEAAIYMSQRGNDAIYDMLPALRLPVTVLRAAPKEGAGFDLSKSPTWPGLAAALPNAREFYFPEMSHFIPMEDPELVATMIREAVEGNWA
jgi:pimeloyl-ACP methyl ester carboxylesterase